MTDNVLNSSAGAASQAATIRAELKTWEKEFASTHSGQKAGREDIKQNPEIAAKYKEYGRLKALESSLKRRENRGPAPDDTHSKKRKYDSSTVSEQPQPDVTPRKASRGPFATPSNRRTRDPHPSDIDPYGSPSTFRKLFSPSTHRQDVPLQSPLKTAIGPTPQRDGKALGLFDILSESGGSRTTPSARKQKNVPAPEFQTPSKPKRFDPIVEAPEEEEEENARLSRTPASSTKQFYLANLFATPTTMRYAAMVEADDQKATTQNASQIAYPAGSPEPNPSETPSFLRRSNSGRYPAPSATNESSGLSPIASRKPIQFAGRGLSHLVQGLRFMEEEREDDEWDILQEIEAEQEAAMFQAPETQSAAQDSQPYKKKGQKRTTRRMNMRPVISRPKPQPDLNAVPDESDSESDDKPATVPETQLPTGSEIIDESETKENGATYGSAPLHSIADPELGSDGETDIDSDGDPEYGEKSKPLPRAKSFSERIKEAVSIVRLKPKEVSVKAPQSAPEEQKKPGRKISAQAHANYRSLKINNRGSRGRGRFRRR
ncbi:hypothetical protein N7462_001891 [Penicillium macrosclerotiorum]|uniref:uncharacterized protein n=1 Tax=Penicillium macrosclerotiorum TaxID=303699 RepID=UPI002549A890|nr:uncharacterized protein N7462_001891 [Penicillium macrosclerotiorum]KAJ5692468.1 hypothetical protein N7462_001891 [Penicillium macrosclerotiorum]